MVKFDDEAKKEQSKPKKSDNMRRRFEFTAIVLLLHFIFIILYGVFGRYDQGEVHDRLNLTDLVEKDKADSRLVNEQYNPGDRIYPMFQDVNVMIFIGFGFLMTFLCRYALFDLSVNFLLSAFAIEWSILCYGFFYYLLKNGGYDYEEQILTNDFHRYFDINNDMLIGALFQTAAILISMGAVLGLCSPLQLVLMTFSEITFLNLNYWIVIYILGVNDPGDSMVIHAFGAYFGIGCARALTSKEIQSAKSDQPGYESYLSEVFSVVGTIFLWIYWPSFNGGASLGMERHRSVINTWLSIASATIVCYGISALVDRKGRFNTQHLQNSTLAGGVAIGSSANLVVHPFGALLVGAVAGGFSTIGFKWLTPWLNDRRFTDTCGVNNLHGMPGIYSAIVSAIVIGSSSVTDFGSYRRLYAVLPKMAPKNGTIIDFEYSGEEQTIDMEAIGVSPGKGYSFEYQAGLQIAGILITLGISFLGGTLTGAIISLPIWDQPDKSKLFDDTEFFVPQHVEGKKDKEEEEKETKEKKSNLKKRKSKDEESG